MSTKEEYLSPTHILHSKSDFKDEFVNGRYVNKGFDDTEGIAIPNESTNNGYVLFF